MTSSNETEIVQLQNTDVDNLASNDKSFEQPTSNCEQPLFNSNSETLECSHCHRVQPISEFYITTNYFHEKRGRTYRCKTCSRESARVSAAKRRQKDEVVLPGG